MSKPVDGDKRVDDPSRTFQRSVRGVVCAVRVLCCVVLCCGWCCVCCLLSAVCCVLCVVCVVCICCVCVVCVCVVCVVCVFLRVKCVCVCCL